MNEINYGKFQKLYSNTYKVAHFYLEFSYKYYNNVMLQKMNFFGNKTKYRMR